MSRTLYAIRWPLRRLTLVASTLSLIGIAVLSPLSSVAASTPTPTVTATSTVVPHPIALNPCDLPLGIEKIGGTTPAQCGTLTVPLDWAHPDSGKTVTLSVDVLPALAPNATGLPIFHLEGGPGAGAISQYEQIWFAAYTLFRQNHPIVLIDQRGMGTSDRINCPEISSHALADLGSATGGAQSELSELAACQARLAKITDTQFYTSDALADDTDAVRAALGYNQILIFSNSYGTDLAQFYVRRHGEHVAGAVLDSAVGPAQEWTLNAPAAGQAAFSKVVALCNADPQCQKAYPDLSGMLTNVLASLKAKPVTFATLTDPHPIVMTSSRLLGILFELLYSSTNLSSVPGIIRQASRGNYLTLGSALIQGAKQDQISEGAYYSIVCSEQAAFYTGKLLKQYIPPASNIFKALYGPVGLILACANWHYATLTAAEIAPVKSDRPVLILSGALDPITPTSYAQAIHATLSHSTVVTFPYQGHGVIVASLCAQQITAAFFDAPTHPVNSACVAKDLKPIFEGAYALSFKSYTKPGGQTIPVPKGWQIQDAHGTDPLTYYSSSDGMLVSATAVFANQQADAVKATLTKLLTDRYGSLLPYENQSQSVAGTNVQILIFFTTHNGQIALGTLVIYQVGNNVAVFWHLSPAVWAVATLSALQPQLSSVVQQAANLRSQATSTPTPSQPLNGAAPVAVP